MQERVCTNLCILIIILSLMLLKRSVKTGILEKSFSSICQKNSTIRYALWITLWSADMLRHGVEKFLS